MSTSTPHPRSTAERRQRDGEQPERAPAGDWQAVAKHLVVPDRVGLVHAVTVGREKQFRVDQAQLTRAIASSPTPALPGTPVCGAPPIYRRKRTKGIHLNQAEVRELMNDRVARALIQAPIHARLAYTAKDGSPRVVPIGYIWNGDAFVMASPPNAPKVKALSAARMVTAL